MKGTDTFIVAVIHDEIVLERNVTKTDETALLLKNRMEKAGSRYMKDVPVIAEASVANSWAEKWMLLKKHVYNDICDCLSC